MSIRSLKFIVGTDVIYNLTIYYFIPPKGG